MSDSRSAIDSNKIPDVMPYLARRPKAWVKIQAAKFDLLRPSETA